MKEVKLYFRDSVNPSTIQTCCLHSLKNAATAVVTENFLLIDSSMPISEKEILVSEARAAGKTILINENGGVCDEANLLHK